MRDEDTGTFSILKGWDLGNAAQVRCPECERRFFVEGEAYKGKAYTECPSCDYEEQKDFKDQESPPLTF